MRFATWRGVPITIRCRKRIICCRKTGHRQLWNERSGGKPWSATSRRSSNWNPRQREAVLLRVEFGYEYRDIAEAIGSPSANGARMVVSRALARVARAMEDGGKP